MSLFFYIHSIEIVFITTLGIFFSQIIEVSVHNEPSPLLACCSWAPCNTPSSPVRIFPVRAKGCRCNYFLIFKYNIFDLSYINISALDGVPAHEQLHLTLAYNYDKNDSITLSSMVDRFEYIDASEWEIKLFSRDIRPAQSQVSINSYFSLIRFCD